MYHETILPDGPVSPAFAPADDHSILLCPPAKLPCTPFTADAEHQVREGGIDPVFGNVSWRTLISSDRTPSADMVLGIAEFPANGMLHPHRHAPTEFYLGLSGDGVVTIDGNTYRIATGIAVFIPGNAEHAVAAGADGLSFAYGFAKDAFSDIDYVFSEPRA